MSNSVKTALLGAVILSTSALLSTQAHAGLDGNPFEGLYGGININYSKIDASVLHSEITVPDEGVDTFGSVTSTSSGSGFGGNAYGGIGFNMWGPLYLGVEGGLGMNGGSVKISDGTTELGLKAKFTFDLSGRVGFTVSDNILIYGLGGYTSTKFGSQGFTTDQSTSLSGYRYGAGLEFGIMEDLAIRVEYVRTEYSQMSLGESFNSFTFDPSSQIFRIGVILHMD